MKRFLNNRTSWFVCIGTFLIAFLAFWVLPDKIPMHFNSQGIADHYSGKVEIFLLPVIQAALIFCSDRTRVKGWFLSLPSMGNTVKYYLMIFAVVLFLLAGEIFILAYCARNM